MSKQPSLFVQLGDDEKACETCGVVFTRKQIRAYQQSVWDARRFCSRPCSWIGQRKDYPEPNGSVTKACGRCGEEKALDHFPLRGKSREGRARYGYCKPCHSAYQRELRMRRLFSLSVDDYDKILEFQGSLCAICGSDVLANGRRLSLDHDHKSGLIRGALCWSCNRSLGWWRDNVERMRSAIAYLEDPPATRALGREVYGRVGRVTNKATGRRANKKDDVKCEGCGTVLKDRRSKRCRDCWRTAAHHEGQQAA